LTSWHGLCFAVLNKLTRTVETLAWRGRQRQRGTDARCHLATPAGSNRYPDADIEALEAKQAFGAW
jgi:hypothetical protein